MSFSIRLKERRESLNMSRNKLAKLIGVTPSAIGNYENGVSFPKEEILYKIFDALKIEPNYLWQDEISQTSVQFLVSYPEREHIKKYRALDEFGQGTVNLILDREYSRRTAPVKEIKPDSEDLIDILEYLTPVSAGTGVSLDGTGEYEHIKVISNMYTRKADYCLTVKGNSMEPKFYDGDKLLVHETDDIEYGEIGIFIVDGQGYVKKKGEYQLISLNDRVPNVYIDPFNEYHCVGLVIGTLDPDWMR